MSHELPRTTELISAYAWRLPSGQRVNWCFDLTHNELKDCWILETVDGSFMNNEEQTRKITVSLPLPPKLREELIADLQRVDIQHNWQDYQNVYPD